MFGILRILTRGMLRTTVSRIGVTDPDRSIRVAVTGITVAVIASNLVGVAAVSAIGQSASDVAAFATALLWFQAAGIVVLVQNIGFGQSDTAAGLKLVPLTPVERVAAISVPLAFVAAMSSATLLGPAALAIADHGNVDIATAVIASLLVIIGGSGVGFLCWATAAVVCDKVRPLRNRAYPVSIILLVTLVSTSLPVLGEITGQAPPDAPKYPALLEAAYLWPNVARYINNPSVAQAALSVAVTVFTLWVVARAAMRVAPLLLAEPTPPPTRFAWKSHGPLPIYRLELTRLLRNRRVITAMATTATMGFVGVLGALLNHRRGVTDVDIAPVIGVLMTVPASQITLLARGLTARKFPYLLTLGYSPTRWSFALASAAITLIIVVVGPLMGILALTPGVDLVGLQVVVAYQAMVFVTTAAFGAFARPGRDNPAGEFIGLLMSSGIAAAITTGIAVQWGGDHPYMWLATVAVIVTTTPLVAWIEKRRWTALVGTPPSDPIIGSGMVNLESSVLPLTGDNNS